MIQEVGLLQRDRELLAASGRACRPGARPYTLIDYFPKDFLLIIDESHVTIPQVRAMWAGDRSRKEVLVEHGFRLPSALDNRPLRFEEFQESWARWSSCPPRPDPSRWTSATTRWSSRSSGRPGCSIRRSSCIPASDQVQHLLGEIEKRVAVKERMLVTTLTKRMAEDLAGYICQEGLSVQVPAQRDRHARADRDPPRPAARRVRRPGRREPAS